MFTAERGKSFETSKILTKPFCRLNLEQSHEKIREGRMKLEVCLKRVLQLQRSRAESTAHSSREQQRER